MQNGLEGWGHGGGVKLVASIGPSIVAVTGINGRAEAEVGVIRRGINTLIRSSGEGEELWPLVAKHVGE